MTLFANELDDKADVASHVRVPAGRPPTWASMLVCRWTKWRHRRATRALLDALSAVQLQDLGLRRVGCGVRWLDHGEALPRDHFAYDVIADDAAGRVRTARSSIKPQTRFCET
ncbi:DUF1127 domain-containing protein [Mesorhizobium sp. KR1-2]|uniref:DUF1127 domain-containing protein n=1 Tax=Mesorhizobium sp. KR1-2 TaxID=3156609 RepID=UPI0032B60E00